MPKDRPHQPKQKAQQKRRGQGETETERMSQDVPDEIKEEIDALQSRLAVLKEKHGM